MSRYLKRDRKLAADILSACASLAANTDGIVWIAVVAQSFGIPLKNRTLGQEIVLDLVSAAFCAVDRGNQYEEYAEAEVLVREGWEPNDGDD